MRLLLFCLTFFFLSCAKKSSGVEQSKEVDASTNQLIENSIGKNYLRILNESKNLSLMYQQDVDATSVTKYIVLDNSNNTIISKGSFKAGYVKWKSDNSIEILDVPGMIPKEKTLADYIKIINLPIQNK
jgi:hypothetical protein